MTVTEWVVLTTEWRHHASVCCWAASVSVRLRLPVLQLEMIEHYELVTGARIKSLFGQLSHSFLSLWNLKDKLREDLCQPKLQHVSIESMHCVLYLHLWAHYLPTRSLQCVLCRLPCVWADTSWGWWGAVSVSGVSPDTSDILHTTSVSPPPTSPRRGLSPHICSITFNNGKSYYQIFHLDESVLCCLKTPHISWNLLLGKIVI